MWWIRRRLRGNQVFARADADGTPTVGPGNIVEVVYKLVPGAKIYRAALRNLESDSEPPDDEPICFDIRPEKGAPDDAANNAVSAPIPEDAIQIYTDGACTGNPGPMGIGIVLTIDGQRTEIGEFLGDGTNNIAELTAIERALQAIPDAQRTRTVVLHSDSSYSIGLLTKGWKAKANTELVARIRELVARFSDLRFVKVRGHAGVPDNERCDQLATGAIATAQASSR